LNSTTFNFNNTKVIIEFSDIFDTSISYEPLKIHFLIISNSIIMKVLNQDDKLRFSEELNPEYKPLFIAKIQDENNKINDFLKFYSLHNVEINSQEVFLRGSDVTSDKKTASYSFNSTIDSLRFVAIITDIFKNIPCLNAEITAETINIEKEEDI
jgi:hypothetical protein